MASNSCFQHLANSWPNLAAGCRSDRPRLAPSVLRPTLLSPTCVGVQLSRKVVPKKRSKLPLRRGCQQRLMCKVVCWVFYNYHTFQVCFNLDMKFQARICWAFCLRGMSRTVSAVGGIQGSFTQQKNDL